MRRFVWLVLAVNVGGTFAARAPDKDDKRQRETLEDARMLAGPDVEGLPIELTSALHDKASEGVEAWTVYDESGLGSRIVVYTGSEVFRCANNRRGAVHRCMLWLASALVHEAWHFRNGPNEAAAYQVQLRFLIFSGASDAQLSGLRVSRDRALAAERKKVSAARKD
jgi:hypothetical protein